MKAEIEVLYKELLAFRFNRNFRKYGFALSKKARHRWWLGRVLNMQRIATKRGEVKEVIILENLRQLGIAYAVTKTAMDGAAIKHRINEIERYIGKDKKATKQKETIFNSFIKLFQ